MEKKVNVIVLTDVLIIPKNFDPNYKLK